jgi:hypothetical protein
MSLEISWPLLQNTTQSPVMMCSLAACSGYTLPNSENLKMGETTSIPFYSSLISSIFP